MRAAKWYVLTGGPSSGKSTLIDELRKRGFPIVNETARAHAEKKLKNSVPIGEIRKDEKAFQEAVFREKEIIHDALSQDVVTFFDRGYHDTIAYLKHFGHEIANFISDTSDNFNYSKIFLLEMLPYVNDEARIEDEETAQGIHKALKEAYEKSNHQIINVPVMPVEERADFVLQHLDEDDKLSS